MTQLAAIPTLTTERLVLRAPCAEDAAPFAAFYASDAAVFVGGPLADYEAWRYLAGVVGHWHLRGYGRWIVERQDAPGAIGLVGLHAPPDWPEPEVGWMIWDGTSQGFAREAAFAARAFAYETLGMRTLISSIAPENAASLKVARHMGATRDAQDFTHPKFGTMQVWRHPGPEVLAA